MTINTTTYWEHPYPADNEDVDVPTDIQALAEALDDVTKFSSGLAADRPVSTGGTPGKRGRFYWSTDTAALEFDTGTSWVGLNVKEISQTFTTGEDTALPAAGKRIGGEFVPAGTLVAVRHKVESGAGSVVKLQRNAADIHADYNAIALSTTATTITRSQALARFDELDLLCVTQGAGKGLTLSCFVTI